jgi:acyl transferase domain-containing protein
MPVAPKIVLCEGQGSVVPGKGRDKFEKSPVFRAAFAEIQSHVDTDLSEISWGADRFRTKTNPHWAHLYSLAHQYAQFRVLEDAEVDISAVTGHSLGELLALIFCGAVSVEQGAALIDRRGRLFERNAKLSDSDMVALIGPPERIADALAAVPVTIPVHLANRNSPSQVVVAVDAATIPALLAHFLPRGVRTVPLQLGNGCHSPFVAAIDEELSQAIDALEIRSPRIPFFSASFTEFLAEPEAIRSALKRHLLAPVEWSKSMLHLATDRPSFLELGYAKVLKGMMLEVDRTSEIQVFEAWDGRGAALA